MEDQNPFKQIEEPDRHLTDDYVKEQVIGSLYLFKNLFQVVELFSSRFSDSMREMVGGRQSNSPKFNLPPHSTGEVEKDEE